jgi:hypothetical protein
MESFTNLTDLKKNIPAKVRTHLQGLLKETGLPDDKDTMKKWYESEKKNFDIGLMKALEELPEYQPYIEFAALA